MSKNLILELNRVEKLFPHPRGPVYALKNISFAVEPGETLAIVGVSGAGKSTLLHLLGALDSPTGGSLVFEGRDFAQLEPLALAEIRNRRLGFVFQFHHLLPEFDSLENVMVPALIARKDKNEARERAKKILTELGLEDRMHHRLGELSGGEQQRVAVARAVMLEPSLVLCDEPTGNLDAQTGKKVEDLLLELNRKKNLTLVIVTHNEDLARRMKRVIRLFNGEMVSDQKTAGTKV
jgi:lipoprotein-releasing system ATP-binding protein